MTENTMDVLPLAPHEQFVMSSQTLAYREDPPEELVAAPTRLSGRIFAPEQEPLLDGVLYTALDGGTHFRPTWRVADRGPGLVAGPDVWFDRDHDGAIRLRWRLTQVRPPGAPADARPLILAVNSVTLTWNGGSHAFEQPPAEPDLTLVLPLLPDDARAVELAMSDAASGCRLDVVHTVHWRVPFPQPPGSAPAEREEYLPISQRVPFVFNPNDDANRPIYRALHGAANLTDTWQKSSAGWLRASPFPNTIYRLPDEVRLAFDPDLGTPHVITTLHTDEAGHASVRVLLRVAPWQDPRAILETRALTGSAGASVIVGPVEGATLRLGGSFPDGIRMLGAAGGGAAEGVPVPLDEGADLLMDLSLEYFQLLCDLLGGAVGLPGTVEVALGEETPPVPVPVSLRMDRVDDLPVGVEVLAAASGSPTAVRVGNRAGTAIRVGGCAATFLRMEGGTVVPLASYPARCTSAFPLELAAGATADLTFEPTEPQEGDRWNAVLVELLDKTMVDDARATLLRAQELAGTGELTWDLTVSTPVFDTPTPRWATLASIEVEVSAPGFETTAVVLRRDTTTRTVLMRKPLAALVAGGAAGIRAVTYRVRNNHADRQGPWTEPQQQAGEELVVFPNPADA